MTVSSNHAVYSWLFPPLTSASWQRRRPHGKAGLAHGNQAPPLLSTFHSPDSWTHYCTCLFDVFDTNTWHLVFTWNFDLQLTIFRCLMAENRIGSWQPGSTQLFIGRPCTCFLLSHHGPWFMVSQSHGLTMFSMFLMLFFSTLFLTLQYPGASWQTKIGPWHSMAPPLFISLRGHPGVLCFLNDYTSDH